MPPWQGGGNMIADVTLRNARCIQEPPNKFEAGTGNIADAVGLGEALRYVEPGRHRNASPPTSIRCWSTRLRGWPISRACG